MRLVKAKTTDSPSLADPIDAKQRGEELTSSLTMPPPLSKLPSAEEALILVSFALQVPCSSHTEHTGADQSTGQRFGSSSGQDVDTLSCVPNKQSSDTPSDTLRQSDGETTDTCDLGENEGRNLDRSPERTPLGLCLNTEGNMDDGDLEGVSSKVSFPDGDTSSQNGEPLYLSPAECVRAC